MHPFALALGINAELFAPWKDLLVSDSDTVLLVEGKIDQEYLEYFRNPLHGDNQLKYSGPILPYEGKDSLKAGAILRFIREHFKKCVVTYDLDAESQLSQSLTISGFTIGTDAISVGLSVPGKGNIEGMVPQQISARVYSENPDLVTQAMSGSTDEKKSAKNQLKAKMLAHVKLVSDPSEDEFKSFYSFIRRIDKVFQSINNKIAKGAK
jgi:hypothetical protein